MQITITSSDDTPRCSPIRLAFVFALFTAAAGRPVILLQNLPLRDCFASSVLFPGNRRPFSPRRKAIVNNNEHRSFKGKPDRKAYTYTGCRIVVRDELFTQCRVYFRVVYSLKVITHTHTHAHDWTVHTCLRPRGWTIATISFTFAYYFDCVTSENARPSNACDVNWMTRRLVLAEARHFVR